MGPETSKTRGAEFSEQNAIGNHADAVPDVPRRAETVVRRNTIYKTRLEVGTNRGKSISKERGRVSRMSLGRKWARLRTGVGETLGPVVGGCAQLKGGCA